MLPTADPIGGQRKDGDRLFSEVQGQAAVVKSFNIGDSNKIFFFFPHWRTFEYLKSCPRSCVISNLADIQNASGHSLGQRATIQRDGEACKVYSISL